MYLEELRDRAELQGCFAPTPDGLADLDNWLRDSEGLADEKVRRYRAERIHLLGRPGDTDSIQTTRLVEYIRAFGTRLIEADADPDNPETGRKIKCLEDLILSIQNASGGSSSLSEDGLYGLLVDALENKEIPDTAGPYQALAAAAPANSLREIDNASQVCVVGDLHGDAWIARTIADWLRGELSNAESESVLSPYAVFLGDYVNNGLKSIEVLKEVLRLEKEFPKSVILLSGNHEFGETYATALTELLSTHWGQWLELSASLTPGWKVPPNHYGHLRLDLAVLHGAVAGEAVYRKFELWGRSLPLCAQHQNVFMCHSVGPGKPEPGCSLHEMLENAKSDPSDIRKLVDDGYEAWKNDKETFHASVVNNRDITADILKEFTDGIGADVFLVGHTHYRSGDRDMIDEYRRLRRARKGEYGRLATICSSYPRSIDAGHYIAWEFERQRRKTFEGNEPSRDCIAASCIAVLKGSLSHLQPEHLLPLYRLRGLKP